MGMVIGAPVARATVITMCRAVTTVGGLTLSPGVVFLGLAALGAVGFIAYHAFRNDYEVTIEEAGVGPLKLKGVHLVKAGGPRSGGAPTTHDLAVAYQPDEHSLLHKKRTKGEGVGTRVP